MRTSTTGNQVAPNLFLHDAEESKVIVSDMPRPFLLRVLVQASEAL